VAPQLRVFIDCISLRSGDDWKTKISAAILERDRLFLFWSKAASTSKWVKWEWRFALKKKGLEAIDPVPLVSPSRVPPPKELSSLHFNDPLLPHIEAAKTEARP
jgi:hypothetical protein